MYVCLCNLINLLIMKKRKIPTGGSPSLKPFFENENIKIVVTEADSRITEFTAIKYGKEKKFPVVNCNILAAWKQLEGYLADIK